MENQLKWYQKPVVVVLFLIFFFPVGLYLMWKHDLWSKTVRVLISVFFGLMVLKSINEDGKSSNLNTIKTIEDTQNCIVGYDWVYPTGRSPLGAWKFSSDGTFNSSTTTFGGMSTWGNWRIVSPGKIKITYTRTTEGIIPNSQIINLSNCNNLIVGSTTYVKN